MTQHKRNISGIQQIGIGVSNVNEAFTWYRQHFGMDVPVFEEAAEANLMLPYTGGVPQKRHAILAINMKGGGGFEIWQYTSRTPVPPAFTPALGDLGIFCVYIKTTDVKGSYEFLKRKGAHLLSGIVKAPDGEEHFFLQDPYGNIFRVVKGIDWLGKGTKLTGGVGGCMIGVKNMEASIRFYAEILGYSKVIYDRTGVFDDLKTLPGGEHTVQRVLLVHPAPRTGSFSELLGSSAIELIRVIDRVPRKIFSDRFWGDLGFIHLCFDMTGMEDMKKVCGEKGFPFVVDSANSFDMGEAAGHFCYIEDPDGTLIEMVETHKIPILKKWNWYLDLRKRDPQKKLPGWLLKAMRWGRVKD